MDILEAMDRICDMVSEFQIIKEREEFERYDVAGAMAIEALAKQIPEKTKTRVQKEDVKIGNVIFNKGVTIHYCPECNGVVTGSEKYCRKCGQALKF